MRLTIGTKLNAMIISLLGTSIGLVVLASVKDFTDNLSQNMARSTINTATLVAARVRSEISQIMDHAKILGTASRTEFKYDSDRSDYIQQNLGGKRSKFIAVGMTLQEDNVSAQIVTENSKDSSKKKTKIGKKKSVKKTEIQKPSTQPAVPMGVTYRKRWQVINPNKFENFLSNEKVQQETLNQFSEMETKFPLNFKEMSTGQVEFKIANLPSNRPLIRMGVPFVRNSEGKFQEFLVIEIDQTELGNIIKESGNVATFLIDRSGRVLGTSDPISISEGTDASSLPIVQASIKALEDGAKRDGQINFTDLRGVAQMGAFNVVDPLSGLSIITQLPMAVAQKAQKDLFFKAATLGGFFLFLAIALGFMFSRGISNPIQALAKAAAEIKMGNFKVRLKTKKTSDGQPPKSADEIQQFSFTFNEMVSGLEERDRYRDTMNKIQDPEVAKLLVAGELRLGGERKSCAVFFSDIRGFTSLSESIEAEQLVALLNRYMTKMVAVIKKYGGTVDKFVGDAIMALWGAPISREDDAYRAVRACLDMRLALATLNDEFAAEGIPPIRMGMGLNYGSLIAGQMGSEERMDYTAIGDTVNTAARIEASTKAFGTDLLISQAVLDMVPGKFIVEKVSEIQAKGVSTALKIYKVHGYVDENGLEVPVATQWSSYKAEGADKIKVLDQEKKSPAQPAASLPPQFDVTQDIYVPARGEITQSRLRLSLGLPKNGLPGILPASAERTGDILLRRKRANLPANVLPQQLTNIETPMVDNQSPLAPVLEAPTSILSDSVDEHPEFHESEEPIQFTEIAELKEASDESADDGNSNAAFTPILETMEEITASIQVEPSLNNESSETDDDQSGSEGNAA